MAPVKLERDALPNVVSQAEWDAARLAFLAKEKEMTRARDALAAERRRLPMVRIEKKYVFDGPNGKVSLLDLFEGRPQLIVYHFMFAPGVHGWPTAGCPGCSMFTDNIGQFALTHLAVFLSPSCRVRHLPRSPPTKNACRGPRRGSLRLRTRST